MVIWGLFKKYCFAKGYVSPVGIEAKKMKINCEDISVWGEKQATAEILEENLLEGFSAWCGWLEQRLNYELLSSISQRPA